MALGVDDVAVPPALLEHAHVGAALEVDDVGVAAGDVEQPVPAALCCVGVREPGPAPDVALLRAGPAQIPPEHRYARALEEGLRVARVLVEVRVEGVHAQDAVRVKQREREAARRPAADDVEYGHRVRRGAEGVDVHEPVCEVDDELEVRQGRGSAAQARFNLPQQAYAAVYHPAGLAVPPAPADADTDRVVQRQRSIYVLHQDPSILRSGPRGKPDGNYPIK